ncbi:MAG: hypothetical protein NVSMB68_15400 [Thermoanaerobaculia bacterium]
MRAPGRLAGVIAVVWIVCASTYGGSAQTSFVPWKVLEPGAEPVRKAFVLFWIPASADEMRRSELITSQRLTLYAGRCMAMHVVRADDSSMLEKLRAAGPLPMAILVEGEREVARVLPDTGALSAFSVESMVRQAVDTREVALNRALDTARIRAASGDNASAIDLYREVAAQECAFPRLARTAQRALRRLGVKN